MQKGYEYHPLFSDFFFLLYSEVRTTDHSFSAKLAQYWISVVLRKDLGYHLLDWMSLYYEAEMDVLQEPWRQPDMRTPSIYPTSNME